MHPSSPSVCMSAITSADLGCCDACWHAPQHQHSLFAVRSLAGFSVLAWNSGNCNASWLPESFAPAAEAGNVETDRSLRSLMSARRSEEDMSALMHAALHPQARKQHAWEPMTPQDAAEGTRLLPSQAWLLSHTMTASSVCYVINNCVTCLRTTHETVREQTCCAHLSLFCTAQQYRDHAVHTYCRCTFTTGIAAQPTQPSCLC